MFAYEGSLTAKATNGADLETAKVVETYEQDDHDLEIEEDADLPEIRN